MNRFDCIFSQLLQLFPRLVLMQYDYVIPFLNQVEKKVSQEEKEELR